MKKQGVGLVLPLSVVEHCYRELRQKGSAQITVDDIVEACRPYVVGFESGRPILAATAAKFLEGVAS